MSYTELLTASADGQLTTAVNYKNSHGFAALIWNELCKKYAHEIGLPVSRYMSLDSWPQLWKWAARPGSRLLPYEANVLVMSYDRAFTKGKENILLYADSLEQFSKAFNIDPQYVNHLPKIAEDLRKAAAEGAEYVAWYAMSVGENLFYIHTPEADEDDENEEVDWEDGHLLSFSSEEDMKRVSPAEWKMVPLTSGTTVATAACDVPDE